MGISKLKIQSDPKGLHIFRSAELGENYQSIVSTREELIDALLEMPDSDEFLENIQEKKLAKKKEEYEKLKPIGFEYAPVSAKQKWEALRNEDNFKQMEYLNNNISYNTDGTMNIIALKKTFCEDISGNQQTLIYENAKKLAISKGYKLMTDYNDIDTEEIKKQSDWYKVINLFSGNKGDNLQGMELFRDMAGCDFWYWTDTSYKDNDGKDISGIVILRELHEDYCDRHLNGTISGGRVCGFKDSM